MSELESKIITEFKEGCYVIKGTSFPDDNNQRKVVFFADKVIIEGIEYVRENSANVPDIKKNQFTEKDFDMLLYAMVAITVLYFGGHILLWAVR